MTAVTLAAKLAARQMPCFMELAERTPPLRFLYEYWTKDTDPRALRASF
jgi:hypothetical protein